jgi:hypothetical protein
MSVPVGLQKNVQHRAGVIDSPPQPVFLTTDLGAYLIQVPSGTLPGFPVTELFGEERRELDIPLAEGFVTDDNAALVQQFLNIALAQGKPVVEPKGVLDDAERKSVLVGLTVSHGPSAYCGQVARTLRAARRPASSELLVSAG